MSLEGQNSQQEMYMHSKRLSPGSSLPPRNEIRYNPARSTSLEVTRPLVKGLGEGERAWYTLYCTYEII